MRCRHCLRPLGVRRSGLALLGFLPMTCPEEECSACRATMLALGEPPAQEPEPEWNPAPEDRFICPDCRGSGLVRTGTRDWETGVLGRMTCRRCRGAGTLAF